MPVMIRSTIMVNGLCALILAIFTIGGYFSPSNSFGQWLAPYMLAATTGLLLPIVATALIRLLP